MSVAQLERSPAEFTEYRMWEEKPTAVGFAETVVDKHHMKWLVKTPCSLTRGLEAALDTMPGITVIQTTDETNIGGIVAGLSMSSGELVGALSQNSGFPKGKIGFQELIGEHANGIGNTVYFVTGRGIDPKDNSIIHRFNGQISKADVYNLFRENMVGVDSYAVEGGSLYEDLDRAVAIAKSGHAAALLVAYDGFVDDYSPVLPKRAPLVTEESEWEKEMRERIIAFNHGTFTPTNPLPYDRIYSRREAVHIVIETYRKKYGKENLRVVVGNGFNIRGVLGEYEDDPYILPMPGYMGGEVATAVGLAMGDKDKKRFYVALGGDQAAQMQHMLDHLKVSYPDRMDHVFFDNESGASVAARSIQLTADYRKFARVMQTEPEQYELFNREFARVEDTSRSTIERTQRFIQTLR